MLSLASREAGRAPTFEGALLQATWAWAATVLGDRRVRRRAVGSALAQSAALPQAQRVRVLYTAGQAARVGRDRALFDEVITALEAVPGPWAAFEGRLLHGASGAELLAELCTGLEAEELTWLRRRAGAARA